MSRLTVQCAKCRGFDFIKGQSRRWVCKVCGSWHVMFKEEDE